MIIVSTNKTLDKNRQFNLAILVALFQNRNKIFTPTEIKAYVKSNISTSTPDPLWPYTQLKKNYNQNKEDLIFSQYLNESFFTSKITTWGASNRFVDCYNLPYWAHFARNQDWFWKQKRTYKIASWLRVLPGVKQVFLCGSTVLEIAKPKSDIDLAVQAYSGQLLLARFWVKVVLKAFSLDNHTLANSFRQVLVRWRVLDQEKVNSLIYKSRVRRQPNNVDCGLFFLQQNQVVKYYGFFEKQLSILSMSRVVNQEFIEDSEENFLNVLYYLPSGKLYFISLRLIRVLLYLTSLPIWPFMYWQLFWYQLKTTGNEDQVLTPNFVSFYQRWF